MKKRMLSLLLTALTLLSLIPFGALSAFAVEAGADTNTEYGTIPEEYRSKTFVAFSDGKCIGASDAFNGTAGDSVQPLSLLRTRYPAMAVRFRYLCSRIIPLQVNISIIWDSV